MNDSEITTLITRLSRPRTGGEVVIERAAILAEGADSPAIIEWITAHSGTPESNTPAGRGGGLHGSRISGGSTPAFQQPMRYVLPANALQYSDSAGSG